MNSSNRLPISVVMPTRNSIETLKECIESLHNIDDIVILDGYSTDGTREYIQTQSNCRLIDQNKEYLDQNNYIIDFAGMFNFGYQFTKHPWILYIDSDEILSPSLEATMKHLIEIGRPGVWYVKRTFTYNGNRIRTLKRATSDHIRFYHRSCVGDYYKPVHEKVKVLPHSFIDYIDEEIVVPLVSLDIFRKKSDRYLAIEVRYRRNIPFFDWCKYLFIRNIYSIFRRTLVIFYCHIAFSWKECMPLGYEYEKMRYLVLLSLKTCPLFKKKGT